jgi:Flp pilus assembly protein TadG
MSCLFNSQQAAMAETRVHRLTEWLCARLLELREANGANVTVTFALATVPMLGFVGAAVDYSHANSVRTAMQAAADSTALMLSKNAASMTSSDIQTKGTDYFKALFNRAEATDLQVAITYTKAIGSQIILAASADVKTDFMRLMGFSKLKLGVTAHAKWGTHRMRVALALDTTGSMSSDGKMTALKSATKSLLSQLKNAATTNGDVYVSIIPFSKGVNVSGIGNKNSSWIKWSGSSDTWDENNGKCKNYSSGSPDTKSECLTKGGQWSVSNHDNWNGCVMDRDQDFDVKNTAPITSNGATLFPAENSSGCPEQLMGLTYDWISLNAKVDSLYPEGMTNQVIGLAWAFQSLTSAPFSIPAKDSNYQYIDAIVLVTDGLNTKSRYSSSQSTIDARENTLCAAAKAAGVVIYTVFINTDGDPSQPVLKNCASSADKAIEVKSASQVITAFNAIASSLTKLRIAQ